MRWMLYLTLKICGRKSAQPKWAVAHIAATSATKRRQGEQLGHVREDVEVRGPEADREQRERDQRDDRDRDARAARAVPEGAKPLRGVAATIAANMVESLGVPTATSIRVVPAKLLEVNRKIINNQLRRTRGGKVSFTHLIGWAMVQGMRQMPAMTSSYHADADGRGYVRRPDQINLGLAMDLERKDGSRTLLVPNIKDVGTLDFGGFFRTYEEVVRKVRRNELKPDLFAGTTATLTNPGTVGTVGSVPRLMPGQGTIIATGAIALPPGLAQADPAKLNELGVGKVMTMTSTYDHRVIQGAESGEFLVRPALARLEVDHAAWQQQRVEIVRLGLIELHINRQLNAPVREIPGPYAWMFGRYDLGRGAGFVQPRGRHRGFLRHCDAWRGNGRTGCDVVRCEGWA